MPSKLQIERPCTAADPLCADWINLKITQYNLAVNTHYITTILST